jgi:N4-gp56 family major capsid protein
MASQRNIAGTTSGDDIKLDNEILDVYSNEILFQAQPVLKFESIAKTQTELMTTPGSTIKFLRYASLTGKSDIAETAKVVTSTLSTSLVPITVGEHVKAVSVSELLLRQAADNVLDRASTLLGMHYAKDRDRLIRDGLLTTTNVLWSQKGGAATSRANLLAGSTFDVNLIRDAVELLATNKAPKFNGDAYVCFVHPHQARYLRSDSAWINVANYATPENMLNGEIGRIEDVRFIETTHVTYIKKTTQNIWADGADTGDDTTIAIHATVDVYQSIIVGDYAIGIAEGLPVEMRDNGVEDFGRSHSLAYYGIWGVGLIEAGHSAILETA